MKVREVINKPIKQEQFDFNKEFNLQVSMKEILVLYAVLGNESNENIDRFLQTKGIEYKVNDEVEDLPLKMYQTVKSIVNSYKKY